ncbi:MAG: rod shape-determining protein MreC [Gemmatimonadetes bacterium]|nr:rod shape-determining protein MreC [Gemmatimonadota bacterium]
MARAAKAGTRIDAALLVASALVAVMAMVLPGGTRDAVAAALQRSLARPLLALQQQSERARAALAERDNIVQRLDSLALRDVAHRQLAAENATLRGLLGIGAEVRTGFTPATALHGHLPGESHTLVLTAGRRDGVFANSAVVAPEGLVGRLTFVDERTSHAILWSHPNFRASAMSADGQTVGIVAPHLTGQASSACRGLDEIACAEPDRMLLELRGVAYRDALDSGTTIVTTGLGGVFPRGIVVGRVIGEVPTTAQWTRTYLLRAAAHPAWVSAVLILSPSVQGNDLSGAWPDSSAAEAARARAVAAGDSLRQLNDAARLAEMQRVTDSIAAAGGAALRDSGRRVP